ncbi:hypothetical protein XPA_006868 [Xanthoria parietina]
MPSQQHLPIPVVLGRLKDVADNIVAPVACSNRDISRLAESTMALSFGATKTRDWVTGSTAGLRGLHSGVSGTFVFPHLVVEVDAGVCKRGGRRMGEEAHG